LWEATSEALKMSGHNNSRITVKQLQATFANDCSKFANVARIQDYQQQ